MKKALIYDPYLDTLGGGERYSLSFASTLKQSGYEVVFAWPDHHLLAQAKKRFNLNVDFFCDASAYELFNRGSLLAKWKFTRQFDFIFWVSDGSLPFLFGKKNFIHFQVPFRKIGGNFIMNQVKSFFIRRLIFNSRFTANVIMGQLPLVSSIVLYPPIDIKSFTPGKKENVILSVARFDSPSHAKRQDVLIDAFADFIKKNKSFRLILAGGLKDPNYLSDLKKKAGKLPVEFVTNPDFDSLKRLYAQAKIFWHAAGYEVDEKKEPEKVEHFGITTVEAMAAGVIPVVINRGGQREIITPITGYLCADLSELVFHSLTLAGNEDLRETMAKAARDRAEVFSQQNFSVLVKSLL